MTWNMMFVRCTKYKKLWQNSLKYSHVTEIHYFSDDCVDQYKNKFNFINLCLHKKNFKISAQWSFFATSYGKTEYDGIGGAVKRLAWKESLQRPLRNQILSISELFEFSKVNITKINFYFISRGCKSDTFWPCRTLWRCTNTSMNQSFHNIKLLDCLGNLEATRISSDEEPTLKYNLRNILSPLYRIYCQIFKEYLIPSRYVASKYDDLWYFGIITEVNTEEGVLLFNLCILQDHRHHFIGPNKRIFAQCQFLKYLLWDSNIIAEPSHTSTGRTYYFQRSVCALFRKKCYIDSI